MKLYIDTPRIVLLQVSITLLLVLVLMPTLHTAEARLTGHGGAAARSNAKKKDDFVHHDQGSRLLEPLGVVAVEEYPTDWDPCFGSTSINCFGSSSIRLVGTSCFDLTQDIKSQQGAIWFKAPYDVSLPFYVNATVHGGNKERGGDGMAFVIQPNSANEYPEDGSGGGGLGYKTIPNAVAVEIDTYKDGTFLNDHVEVKHTSPSSTSLGRTALASDILESKDQEMRFEIEWTAGTTSSHGQSNFFVRLDGEEVFKASLSSISEYLGGATTAYFGFTAATGARHNRQYVCTGSISGGIAPVDALPDSDTGGDTNVHIDEAPVEEHGCGVGIC